MMLSQNLFKYWVFPVLLFFIGLFFLHPLFSSKFFLTHDGEVQVARIGAYYKAFNQGVILPRWAGDLNYGFGAPVFIFFYPLPGYLGSLIHAIGFNLETTFKIILGLSFVGGPLCFYLWTSTFLRKRDAFLASLFFMLAPYHFLDIFVRGDIGELLSFVFIPLVFWSIDKKKILLGSIFYALLILSHHGMAFVFSPVLLGYMLINNWNNLFLRKLFIFFGGLALAAFFWIPALIEGKYIHQLSLNESVKQNYLSLFRVLYTPWGFGTHINAVGGLAPQIGLITSIAVVVSLLCLFLAKKGKKNIIFWIAIFSSSIFMVLATSGVIWSRLSILNQLQFPWRFISIASFAASVLAGFVSKYFFQNRILQICIIVLLLSISLQYDLVHTLPSWPDTHYLSYPGTTAYHGETTTRWSEGDPSDYAKKQLEVIDGDLTIISVIKKTQDHIYIVDARRTTRMIDNTIYFPGWQVLIDNRSVPIEFQDMRYRGFITFYAPSGRHTIKVVFKESSIRLISDIISIMAICSLAVLAILEKKGMLKI